MPVPPEGLSPWDELDAAATEAAEASRSGDLERMRAAAARLDAAHWKMAQVGTALVFEALARGDLGLQKKLRKVFGDAARMAIDKASAANERADRLAARLDAAEQRIRELERAVADLTPGVGEPGRTIGGA